MTTLLSAMPAAERRRAASWMTALAGVLFAVAFDQGTLTGGVPMLHELAHDARHLLGVPCH